MPPKAVEFWTTMVSAHGVRTLEDYSQHARMCEEHEGWDGILIGDSQNYGLDLYVKLTVAGMASSRIGLGSFVTNPVTRHPAVTATAMASVNKLTSGRVVLGIGRGDSALAHIGGAPLPVPDFERFLTTVRTYLRGQPVTMEEAASWCMSPSVTTLNLAARPMQSTLTWLDPSDPIVPVDVLATGPRVIASGARLAERVTLAVNADPARLKWGIDIARGVRADVSVGGYMLVFVSDDLDWARHMARGMLAATSRFSAMHGTVVGPTSDEHREVYQALSTNYDLTQHARVGAPHVELLTDSFVDACAIVGPAGHCVERLQEIAELGIDRIAISTARTLDRDSPVWKSQRALVDEVLPRVRG